jgi:ammonium transporter Rh
MENAIRYPAFQDVNVMMLIGFGFLMTFIKTYSWSALSYTFFINAIVVQLYILFSGFWSRVIVEGFAGHNEEIMVETKSFTAASYCVAAVLISLGGILGRLGPKQLLIMACIETIGYTLNEVIVYEKIKIQDDGGSMAIHSFGAYFGLTLSLIIAKQARPVKKP